MARYTHSISLSKEQEDETKAARKSGLSVTKIFMEGVKAVNERNTEGKPKEDY